MIFIALCRSKFFHVCFKAGRNRVKLITKEDKIIFFYDWSYIFNNGQTETVKK